MILRDYQAELAGQTQLQWALGHKVVLMRLDTGGGKTPILSKIVDEHNGFVAAIAHRDKLVEQISLMLARAGIRHDIVAAEKTKRLIAKKHVKKLGQCFYVPGARCRVASIDTLVRAKDLAKWASQVTLWIVDEGHHVLRENKWGRGVALFDHPSCLGLLLTATPGRPDGKGLGRWADGFADTMVEGPPMRWLIDEGYLCDYDVVCPPSDLVADEAPKGADGEYTTAQRRSAERKSHIVGDVPKHYLKFAAGLSGITFSGTIETAVSTVAAYRAVGVTAELITGETDTVVRDQIFDRAERGELQQIVAVDVISEGVDIPALQVGSLSRLTGSIITWRQQIGRLLRPIYADGFDLTTREGRLAAIAASKKPRALLIDHVGGFINPSLGAPDRPRLWSLDRREKRKKKDDEDEIPLRICANPEIDCFHPYPRIFRSCPKCGYEPEPQARSLPAHVDGDLQLLTPEALAALQGRVLDIHMSRAQHDAAQLAKGAQSTWLNRHWGQYIEKRDAVVALLDSMDLWAGQLHAAGRPDYEIQREFFLRFGVDPYTAQSLDATATKELKERIDGAVNSLYALTG